MGTKDMSTEDGGRTVPAAEMETRNRKSNRKKTISSVFFRYACVYTAGGLFLAGLLLLAWYILDGTGVVLPANHMETSLNASANEIRRASEITEEMLPEGCTYGVYRPDGGWRYGTFPSQEIRQAWENYEQSNIYVRGSGYYRFFQRDAGEVCIVKYEIAARFRNRYLEKLLPAPDVLLVLSFTALFIIYTVLMSRRFGKYMRARLRILNEVTEKIRRQDLEFAEEHSELKEVDDVLLSLSQMKEALKDSLRRQWDMEKNKEEQIAALAHDIKTPLTVIRGNAELLAEEELTEEARGYDQDILKSVSMIEEYLVMLSELLVEAMQRKGNDAHGKKSGIQNGQSGRADGFGREERSVLSKDGRTDTQSRMACDSLAALLMEQARLLTAAGGYPVIFRGNGLQGELWCDERQILRAFHNILSNAMDYSPPDGRIEISLEMRREREREYLAVTVADEGPGFTAQDLRRATEQFYQGDQSRSSKTHYGIGLHTAEKIAEEQGGYLIIENAETRGARVTIMCSCDENAVLMPRHYLCV
ncbi:MAG: sensor histidine kinase [Lachnospiraceae bacterium]